MAVPPYGPPSAGGGAPAAGTERDAELYERFGLRRALVNAQGVPVWRSRTIAAERPGDVELLGGLGLADVWDLRTEPERAAQPDADLPGVRIHALPNQFYVPADHRPGYRRSQGVAFAAMPVGSGAPAASGAPDAYDGRAGVPGQAGAVLAGRLTSEKLGHQQPGERMLDIYRTMGEHAEQFAPVIRAVVEARRPLLVHCISGKDRTGVVCYCVERLLGASHADALEGYLATNAANASQNAHDLEALAKRGVPPWRLEVALSLFLAKEEYLEAFLEATARRFGTLDAYLAWCMSARPEA